MSPQGYRISTIHNDEPPAAVPLLPAVGRGAEDGGLPEGEGETVCPILPPHLHCCHEYSSIKELDSLSVSKRKKQTYAYTPP